MDTDTDNNKMSYIKIGDKQIINEKAITWVRKMDECLYICSSTSGCLSADHIVCKYKTPNIYDILDNKWFK